MFTQEKLEERGWSKKLIEKLLGAPDDTTPSSRYRKIKPTRLWERTRVEAAEKHPDFIAHQFRYYNFSTLSKTAAALRQQETLDDSNAIDIYVKHWSLPKLDRAVIREWEQTRRLPRGVTLIEDINASERTELYIDYIRNNLVYIGKDLVLFPAPIDTSKLDANLEHEIYCTIAEAYPSLASRAHRRADHLAEQVTTNRSGGAAPRLPPLMFAASSHSSSAAASACFREKTRSLPATTEAERLLVQRIGQGVFREMLFEFWSGRCAVTGLDQPELLRASHMKPWAKCATDAERLDQYNGLLLSAQWDAAFDSGLVTLDDDGTLLLSDRLTPSTRQLLLPNAQSPIRVLNLKPTHLPYLRYHREHVWCRWHNCEESASLH